MNLRQQKLVIGCLLHDFGKLLYRYNDGRNHSKSGYDNLKNIKELETEKEILECVKYHHSTMLKNAAVEKNALCYIAYVADNIASAVDRRENDSGERGFVRDIASESIFNILNGNKEKMLYAPEIVNENVKINYPSKENIVFNETFYSKIIDNIKDSLRGIEFNDNYINSLIQVLETNLLYVPSSTQTGELRDISLFDHLKLTAAFGICIEQYLTEENNYDYKETLYKNSKDFYNEKCFRVYSFDLSGIQNFIYNISSKSALKGLRARSFYLEIVMEDIVDELLDRLNLCRANVMYTGGGHTYIIIPATNKAKKITDNFETELNKWFIETFATGLYASGGYADCSSNDLQNKPNGKYKEIFRKVSQSISERKLCRYNKENILKLNSKKEYDYSRECVICHRSAVLDKDDECGICSSLKNLSDTIIGNNEKFFTVVKSNNKNEVPLPFGCTLNTYSKEELIKIMKDDESGYKRAYSKNKGYTGNKINSMLWVGDYAAEKEFSKLIEKSEGIKRLAVIRADVDNLGQSFVSGFEKSGENGKYETITRTAVFSRKLSEFFKHHINYILKNGEYQLFDDKETKERNAVIVYSGGDDIFIVGGWDDIICFAVDLRNSLKKFTQNTLKISAGIGIFPEKYPISSMAEKTGELEEFSKNYKNGEKNAVTLFGKEGTYNWDEFIDNVLGEKLATLKQYIANTSEHDKALLYKMLELIHLREEENRLNIARFAYLLARLKPDLEKSTEKEINSYKSFSKNMYSWIQDKEESRRLVTAIYIYIYMNREREEFKNE